MASNAQEDLKQSGSAEMGKASQLQQARPCQAADNQCPICLDTICHAAHVPTCFHCFCFHCICQWAATNAVCPICRQPFHCILCATQADGEYQQYMLRPFTRRQRRTARERVRNRTPQRYYNLRLRYSNDRSVAGRTEPAGGQRVLQVSTAAVSSGTSSAPSNSREPALPDALQRPASPVDRHPGNFSMLLLRARLLHFLGLE